MVRVNHWEQVLMEKRKSPTLNIGHIPFFCLFPFSPLLCFSRLTVRQAARVEYCEEMLWALVEAGEVDAGGLKSSYGEHLADAAKRGALEHGRGVLLLSAPVNSLRVKNARETIFFFFFSLSCFREIWLFPKH